MLCRCGLGSGGGFERDAVAHRHQLRDVGACSAFGVDPGGVVVGAEVGVAGGGVVEHVPDDDQDRAGDSDERLEFAAAFDDAPVALAEEGVCFRGRGGGLAERPFEIRVAPAGLAAALDRSGLDGAWTQFGLRHQMRGGGEPAHVEPDLGQNACTAKIAVAR